MINFLNKSDNFKIRFDIEKCCTKKSKTCFNIFIETLNTYLHIKGYNKFEIQQQKTCLL